MHYNHQKINKSRPFLLKKREKFLKEETNLQKSIYIYILYELNVIFKIVSYLITQHVVINNIILKTND